MFLFRDQAGDRGRMMRGGVAGRNGKLVLSAAMLWLFAGSAASGQAGPDAYAVSIEALCRNYATAQVGMPPDQMVAQCMSERHCRVTAGSSQYQCEAPGPLSWHGGGY